MVFGEFGFEGDEWRKTVGGNDAELAQFNPYDIGLGRVDVDALPRA